MLRLTMLPCAQKRNNTKRTSSTVDFRQDMDMLWDNLSTMLIAEVNYHCHDYLSHHKKQTIQALNPDAKDGQKIKLLPSSKRRVDESCREQICEWCYRVSDYFRIGREVVAAAISYLDRYLSINYNCDRRTFKLAATTALYLAVKVFHPHKLGALGVLSDLSRGEFVHEDIEQMESVMLQALDWRLNGPTAACFVRYLLELLPPPTSKADIDAISDIAAFFTELAVCDYGLVTCRQSEIALASILNAMEGLGLLQPQTIGEEHEYDEDTSGTVPLLYQQDLIAASRPPTSTEADIIVQDEDLAIIRERLWRLYERSEECSLHKMKGDTSSKNNAQSSRSRGSSNNCQDKDSYIAAEVSSPVSVMGLDKKRRYCGAS